MGAPQLPPISTLCDQCAAMPALRNYGNSYDDLADPTKPIKRLVHVEPEPTKPKYEPPVTSKRTSRSRSTLSTKSNAYKTEAIEFESSKDRKITQMKKDVNVMSNQNKTLRGDNKNRMRTIKALEKLMDKEKMLWGKCLRQQDRNFIGSKMKTLGFRT